MGISIVLSEEDAEEYLQWRYGQTEEEEPEEEEVEPEPQPEPVKKATSTARPYRARVTKSNGNGKNNGKPVPTPLPGPRRNRAIREWAKKHGYEVSERGRLPIEVVHAYESAPRT